MKTQTFGHICIKKKLLGKGPPPRHDAINLCALAYLNYRDNRLNGGECDNPMMSLPDGQSITQIKFPKSGSYEWVHGKSDGKVAYGDLIGGQAIFEVYYRPSLADEEWMKRRDEIYLARITRSGDLQRLEPVILEQRERERVAAEHKEIEAKPIIGLADLLGSLGIYGDRAAQAIKAMDPSKLLTAVNKIQASNPPIFKK